MSPTKRPSRITGLSRGLAASTATAAAPERPTATQLPARTGKPARVTLNMPPQLYRELAR